MNNKFQINTTKLFGIQTSTNVTRFSRPIYNGTNKSRRNNIFIFAAEISDRINNFGVKWA